MSEGYFTRWYLHFFVGIALDAFVFAKTIGEVRSLFGSWLSYWHYCVFLLIWHNVSYHKRCRKLNGMYKHYLLPVKIKLHQRFRTPKFSSSMAYNLQFNANIMSLVHLLLSLIQKVHFTQEKYFYNCF